MVNYFFFISEMRMNEQGEMRTVLRALPNQTTWNNHTRTLVPVRTDLHVQADSDSLGRIVRTPLGTIWGICIEGNTPHAASLKTYHRNNRDFYRADDCVKDDDFDADMMAAYREVRNRREPELPMGDTATEAPAQTPSANAPEAATRRVTPAGPAIHDRLAVGRDFIEGLKNSTEDLSNGEMLMLARLYDRLVQGVVRFTYVKNADSSTRQAIGTRNPDVIRRAMPEDAEEAIRDRRASTPFDGVHVAYFDLERLGWRSFTVENFVAYDNASFVPAPAA